MRVFHLVDNQNHTSAETDSTTVGELANELGLSVGQFTASIGGNRVEPNKLLEDGNAVAFISQRKSGGKQK